MLAARDFSPASAAAAAAAVRRGCGCQFSCTEINFDTPGSSIVTPYRRSAISIVLRLWVIRMNWVRSCMPWSISTNLPMFASSSGASISSSRQNGLGRYWKIANINAIAVSAFSPPESNCTF